MLASIPMSKVSQMRNWKRRRRAWERTSEQVQAGQAGSNQIQPKVRFRPTQSNQIQGGDQSKVWGPMRREFESGWMRNFGDGVPMGIWGGVASARPTLEFTRADRVRPRQARSNRIQPKVRFGPTQSNQIQPPIYDMGSNHSGLFKWGRCDYSRGPFFGVCRFGASTC